LFTKVREALIGARDDIILPPESQQVDWEAELALVIGTSTRHASPDEAARAIAGFTVANDISMRDWQYRAVEWLPGKTWEHATPVGPWLVTPDELGGTDPDLEIGCEVDGEVRQASRTSELVFSATDLVAYVSEFVTLEPGDLILTGTPAGVGHGMHPPTYLQPGQVVRTVIGHIGELENRCTPEAR
jgi:acylpyruvate hydrolase